MKLKEHGGGEIRRRVNITVEKGWILWYNKYISRVAYVLAIWRYPYMRKESL